METQRDAIRAEREDRSRRLLFKLREAVPAVMVNHPVDVAYAFGSVVEGTMLPLSDVDVALLLTEPLPPYDRLKLELTIQGEIEDAIGFAPVDVRSTNAAPLMVRGKIVQQGVLLFERDHRRRVEFEVAIRKRYFDFAPVANRLRDAFLERVYREGILFGQSPQSRRSSLLGRG